MFVSIQNKKNVYWMVSSLWQGLDCLAEVMKNDTESKRNKVKIKLGFQRRLLEKHGDGRYEGSYKQMWEKKLGDDEEPRLVVQQAEDDHVNNPQWA